MPPKIHQTRNEIKVFLWRKEIGTLTWLQDKRKGYFFFSPEYFGEPYDLCPLTAPKSSPESRHAIYGEPVGEPGTRGKIYQGLPPFIADSLPDQWGNAIFDRWFKEKGYAEKEKTPLAKLSFIGNRAMGALEFRPVTAPEYYKDKTIDIDELYRESLSIEKKMENKMIPKEDITTENIQALGTSPGGSRKKALIAIDQEGTVHPGQINQKEGWKEYIIKFNTPTYCLSEIEKTYHDLASEAGIRMMPSHLREISGIQHFLTERFDRKDGKKIFMQTLAAINPEAETYEDLFKTCRRLGINEKEMEQLYRQTVFNHLMNNTDDHRKNFTFVMDERHKWHLSPAYDITFIFTDERLIPETNHCMSLGGKFTGLTESDLIRFGKANDIRNPEGIIRKIREISRKFEEYAAKNGIGGLITEIIATRLDELGRNSEKKAKQPFHTEIGTDKFEGMEFEFNLKGNIIVKTMMNGRERRKTLTPKSSLFKTITEKGSKRLDERERTDILKGCFYGLKNHPKQ